MDARWIVALTALLLTLADVPRGPDCGCSLERAGAEATAPSSP